MKKIIVKFVCLFIPVKSWRKAFKKYLFDRLGGDAASVTQPHAKGNVLVSYMKDSILLKDNDQRLKFHSNRWENREIARIFHDMGYNVDCIDFNVNFYPRKKYDIMFDIADSFEKYADFLKPGALRLAHLTGSASDYNIRQENIRLENLEKRRGVRLPVERQNPNAEKAKPLTPSAIDGYTLVGNEHTLRTYPAELQPKITLIHLTGSELSKVKTPEHYYPQEKEFLWMAGAGPVHKGLDLLLEIFAKHPEWTLNIMGKLNSNKKFLALYHREMFELPNIHYHGLMMPSSDEFNEIIARCFAYINPSCAEATSTATVTALSLGLYPVISYDNGVDLPEGCGIYLDSCSLEEIETALENLWHKRPEQVAREIGEVQRLILKNFSRENFRKEMQDYLKQQIDVYNRRCGL